MKLEFTAAPGVGLASKSLPNGTPIKGITIDNPSGSWLYIVSERQFVPPYTIGWSMPCSYEQSSVTVNAGQSPAGQVSTTQGDPWTLILDSEPVNADTGGPTKAFIDQFTPTLYAAVGPQVIQKSVVNFNVLDIAAIPGKRIRVLGWSAIVGPDNDPNTDIVSLTKLVLFDSLTAVDYIELGGADRRSSDSRIFVPGIDFGVGDYLKVTGRTTWLNVSVNTSVKYQII
jgi:hypothetical protein